MKHIPILLISFLSLFNFFSASAQQPGITNTIQKDSNSIAAEVRAFYDSYGEDLRKNRREAIAMRYDSSGYFRMGNGNKQFYSYEQSRDRYLNNWTGPRSFEWKDLSIVVFSSEVAAVTGLFDNSKVQHFDAGSSFVISANTWHMEWWEEETVEEIEMMSPWKTERATPITPRKSK